jgi:hypothetical protein
MMLKSSEVCFLVMFVTGINSFGEKINMTFLLKGFGEIFIERVAYLELPPYEIIRSFDPPRPPMIIYATTVPA